MKKITFFIAACALCAAVSCSQDEGYDVMADAAADNTIGFISSTSRTDIVTLQDLKDDSDGFKVYGALNNSNAWENLMNGTNNYVFDDSSWWAWAGTAPKWPLTATDYPINFYAIYYDGMASGNGNGITVTDTDKAALSLNYVAPTAMQTDILVAAATAASRPVGDKLALTFKHILSKVNFDVTAGAGYEVFTQSIKLNNSCNERAYIPTTSAWGAQDEDKLDDYGYLDTQNPALSSTDDSIADNVESNLMLIPQSTISWDPTANASTVEGSHICMLYRAIKSDKSDFIGYTDAADHPDYVESVHGAKYNGEPLFVKVGYPLGTPNFIIEAGMGYNYNINIAAAGTTNGYLLDDYYYDKEGHQTIFEVKGKDINDPLADGYIDFTVDVTTWDDKEVAVK